MILAVKLFNLFTSKTEIEQARATLEQITNIIEDLDEGKTAEYLVTGPKDWHLVGFNIEDSVYSFSPPEECDSDSCLCICPSQAIRRTHTYYESADCKAGLCQELEYKTRVGNLNRVKLNITKLTFTKRANQLIIETSETQDILELSNRIFEELKNFKENENSQSVFELSRRYIRERNPQTNKRLEQTLNKFFESKEIRGVYRISKINPRSNSIEEDIFIYFKAINSGSLLAYQIENIDYNNEKYQIFFKFNFINEK